MAVARRRRAILRAWSHYWRTRRAWPLIVAVTVGAAVTLPLWIVYGDPSGNFDGVRGD